MLAASIRKVTTKNLHPPVPKKTSFPSRGIKTCKSMIFKNGLEKQTFPSTISVTHPKFGGQHHKPFSTLHDGQKDLNELNPYHEWQNEKLDEEIEANNLAHLKVVEKEELLRDGGKVQTCILSRDDLKDVEEFYRSLSDKTMSPIKQSTCAYRNYGIEAANYQSYRYLTNLRGCVPVGVRADVNGEKKLVALSFYLRDKTGENRVCRPFGTVVADEYQNKGIGVVLKKAQIECAQIENFSSMQNDYLSRNVIKTWQGACDALGLTLRSTSTREWHGGEKVTHSIDLTKNNL